MIIIPETKILELIEIALLVVEEDYKKTTDKTKTFLYRIFGNNQIGKYNFLKESVDIFTRTNEHPRKIETRMMFDAKRASLPTIHITMPQENNANEGNGIGVDEGYQESIEDLENKTINKTYTRAFDVQYNAVITSDNSLEVLCIYHLLKSALIGMFNHIEFQGIRNVKLSGQDLQINSEMVPPNIFIRGIGISCFYEQTVPIFQEEQFVNAFKLKYCIHE